MGKFQTAAALFVLSLFTSLGCNKGDPDDPMVAETRTKIDTDQYRTSYARAPGWATRQPSDRVHAPSADIYINSVVRDAFCGSASLDKWPDNSILVKDGFDGNTQKITAAMYKKNGVWFLVEWDGDGDFVASGKTCQDCHGSGADYVRSFSFPQDSSLKAAYCATK